MTSSCRVCESLWEGLSWDHMADSRCLVSLSILHVFCDEGPSSDTLSQDLSRKVSLKGDWLEPVMRSASKETFPDFLCRGRWQVVS